MLTRAELLSIVAAILYDKDDGDGSTFGCYAEAVSKATLLVTGVEKAEEARKLALIRRTT